MPIVPIIEIGNIIFTSKEPELLVISGTKWIAESANDFKQIAQNVNPLLSDEDTCA